MTLNSNAIDPLAGLDPEQLLRQGLENAPADVATQEPRPSGSFVPPSIEELQPLLPQFELIELIGRGGMGAVYKARQIALDRLVAIKVLPPQVGRDPAFAERFSREAKALARLSHPRIVAVHDAGVVELASTNATSAARQEPRPPDRLYYIVMEFVDGASLRDVIRAGKLPSAEALAIVPQICEALQFAHDEGIVHRDIKPDNILLDARGRVKIADFGLAKLLDQSPQEVTLTGTHQVMGTLRYMAPEQMEGLKAIDHRADIYSLGVVFYELLTGELPMGRFEPPSQRVQLDVRFDEVVLRSLAREPDKRYQTAGAVKSDVESISNSNLTPMMRHPNRPEPKPAKFTVQTMPRDGADFLHMLAFTPVVILAMFFVPMILTFLIAAGSGRGGTASVAIGGMVGLAVTLGLFVILGMGSVQSCTVDLRGITIRRFFGPGKFLAWEEISRIRLLGRWEVVRQVWVWPGLPPRGSIMGISSKNYFSLDARDGCWYICPTNPGAFIESIRAIEERRQRQWLETELTEKGRLWDGEQSYIASLGMAIALLAFTAILMVMVVIPAAGFGIWLAMMDSPRLIASASIALPTVPGNAIYLVNHRTVVRDVAVSSDGRYLVSVGDDGQMVTRNLDTSEVKPIALGPVNQNSQSGLGLRSVALSNTNEFAYTAGSPQHQAIFKVYFKSGAVMRVPYDSRATLNAVYPTANDENFLCIQGDSRFDVLNSSGQILASQPIYPGKLFGNVRSIGMSPSGVFTAVTSSNMEPDGTGMKSAEPCQLSVFDLDGKETLTWKIPDYADFSFAQLAWADDRTLLIALPSGQLHRWRMNDAGNEWQASDPVRISPGSFTAACLSEDKKSIWLATDRQLMAFDFETGKPTAFANVQAKERAGEFAADAVESICIIRGRDLVAAALWDGRVAIARPMKMNSD